MLVTLQVKGGGHLPLFCERSAKLIYSFKAPVLYVRVCVCVSVAHVLACMHVCI